MERFEINWKKNLKNNFEGKVIYYSCVQGF